MKRRLLALLLAVLTLAALTTAAFAAETETTVKGVYNIRITNGYKLSVKDVEPSHGFYAGATKFELTCTKLSGQYSLVFLINADTKETTASYPTDSNLYYIDQKDVETTTTFSLLPKDMEPGTYNVCVSTDGSNGLSLTTVASFVYGEDPGYMLGDVDDNNRINIADATKVLNYLVDLEKLSKTELLAADVCDKLGKLDIADVVGILNYIVFGQFV